MIIVTPYFGWLLLACLVLAGVTSIVMKGQGTHFYTMREEAWGQKVCQSFSIIDLELPTSAQELKELLWGMGALEEPEKTAAARAVRGQLWVDFLFMPGIYGAIFLLCMKAAQLLSWPLGQRFFVGLAWGQCLAFGFDIIENLTLFYQLKHPEPLPTFAFKAYRFVVSAKWLLVLAGGICALSILFYYWVAK